MKNLEGTGVSQLLQMIRKHGANDFDKFELGTVTAALPDIKVKLANTPLELSAEDLIIAQHLTEHTRTATIKATNVTESMTAAGTPSHTHDITSLTLTDVTIDFQNALSVGDKVILVSMDDGQTYVLIDKGVGLIGT